MTGTTMGHFVSVPGQRPGHQLPTLKTSRSGHRGGGGVVFPGLWHYFRQVSTIFSSQNDNNDGRCYERNDPSFMGHRHRVASWEIFCSGYWIFCKVMFEYFSLIFVGCKYFLLAVIVTPNDCCHINQIH